MDLQHNEVHLYFVYPDQISASGLLQRYKTLLSDDELSQMSRFYHARVQHQYLLTRALIRVILSSYFQTEPREWKFDNNSFGKPRISYPDKTLAVRFNLSHTNGLIMCGIARDYDIGVDVEDTLRSTRAGLDKLSKYFSKTEVSDLLSVPQSQQYQRFFDYWTLKEAYIKARGLGLAIPLDQFAFNIQDNHLKGFSVHPALKDDADNWQFWRIPVSEQYQAAVAINSGDTSFKVSAFRSVPLEYNEPVGLAFL